VSPIDLSENEIAISFLIFLKIGFEKWKILKKWT